MGTISLLSLKQKIAKELGIYDNGTATGNGESDGSTLVCTDFARYADNSLKDKFLQTTSGATLYNRKIESNYANEGIIHPYKVFGAQIVSAITFDIYDLDPDLFTSHINRAITDAYPDFHKSVINTELIGNNSLVNNDFEDWTSSSYPDYWRARVATVAKSTTAFHGTYSCSVTTAAGSCYLSSNNYPALLKLEDSTVNFYCWVKTAAASNARIQIVTTTQAGVSKTHSSSYHTGGDEWELIELEDVDIPDSLAEVRFVLAIATTTTAYFDYAFCNGGCDEYPLPLGISSVVRVNECNDRDDYTITERSPLDFEIQERNFVKYLILGDESSGKKLELIGYEEQTELALATETINASDIWEKIITYGACAGILRSYGTLLTPSDSAGALARAKEYENRYEMLKSRYRMIAAPYRIKSFGR